MRKVNISRDATGETVATNAEVASSMWSRFWGLMFRGRLEPGSALLIDPCSSIHTMFMRFPIDVVFLDKENVVTKVGACVKPWRAMLGGGGKKVVEMPCGAADQAGVAVGDRLTFSEPA